MPKPIEVEIEPLQAKAERETRNGIKHPLDCIAEWRKGCSCGGPMLDRIEGKPIGTSSPAECVECTEALISAIEKWHEAEGK